MKQKLSVTPNWWWLRVLPVDPPDYRNKGRKGQNCHNGNESYIGSIIKFHSQPMSGRSKSSLLALTNIPRKPLLIHNACCWLLCCSADILNAPSLPPHSSVFTTWTQIAIFLCLFAVDRWWSKGETSAFHCLSELLRVVAERRTVFEIANGAMKCRRDTRIPTLEVEVLVLGSANKQIYYWGLQLRDVVLHFPWIL